MFRYSTNIYLKKKITAFYMYDYLVACQFLLQTHGIVLLLSKRHDYYLCQLIGSCHYDRAYLYYPDNMVKYYKYKIYI